MEREIRIEVVLDADAYGAVQLAVMAFLRRQAGSFAVLEDVRLALDEVLLHEAVLEEPSVTVWAARDDHRVRVEILVVAHALDIDEALVRSLVDELEVLHLGGDSRVRFERRWPGPS